MYQTHRRWHLVAPLSGRSPVNTPHRSIDIMGLRTILLLCTIAVQCTAYTLPAIGGLSELRHKAAPAAVTSGLFLARHAPLRMEEEDTPDRATSNPVLVMLDEETGHNYM